MLAIRLDPKIEKRLAALAKKTGRTKTFYAREAILNHLEDMEDGLLAEKRWLEFKRSGEETVSIEEIAKKYGVAG